MKNKSKQKKKSVSFLLGAGFSAPAGLPLASEVSTRFEKLESNDIHIHTQGSAWFRSQTPDFPANDYLKQEERKFIELYVKHYIKRRNGHTFNYEEFADDVFSMAKIRDLPQGFRDFLKENGFNPPEYITENSLAFSMVSVLPQLIGSLIFKKREDINLRPYTNLIKLLENSVGTYKVYLHSLNHDTLLEYICSLANYSETFSDGFDHLGSNYYSYSGNDELIRLKFFQNRFEGNNHIIKLHGSINDYLYKNGDGQRVVLKGSPNGIGPLVVEEVRQNGKPQYRSGIHSPSPNFLSGTNTKIELYGEKSYYQKVFRRFTENLAKSEKLVISGYSFNDSKINQYIAENFHGDLIVCNRHKVENSLVKMKNGRNVASGIEGIITTLS